MITRPVLMTDVVQHFLFSSYKKLLIVSEVEYNMYDCVYRTIYSFSALYRGVREVETINVFSICTYDVELSKTFNFGLYQNVGLEKSKWDL